MHPEDPLGLFVRGTLAHLAPEFDAPGPRRCQSGLNDEARMHMAWDPCRYVLGLAATAPAGQEFFYNTGALTLVSAIIRKATGRPLDEFARATLFEPLGITGVDWNRIRGIPMPEGDCACDRATWRKSASWSLRAGAGTTVRSSLKAGSRPRRHGRSRPRTALWVSLVARPLPAQ